MRVKRPDVPRGFTVPALPVVAVLGIVVCGAMIYGLGWTNWLRLIIWLAIGLVFCFSYGITHSRLGAEANARMASR
jgi:basic amino acid/polyamine antiporter, APA family